jgi:DNA recombination protein RmuC
MMKNLKRYPRPLRKNYRARWNKKLSDSFKRVGESLEQIYKSVGEMTSLAEGVGDLKRVLTNVRARGTWGEHLLGNLLEQILIPEQFETNVEVVPGSNQRVEFAVRLPGDSAEPMWLPLDSKFPRESYDRLKDAADQGDAETVKTEGQELEKQINKAASDISEKYISTAQHGLWGDSPSDRRSIRGSNPQAGPNRRSAA